MINRFFKRSGLRVSISALLTCFVLSCGTDHEQYSVYEYVQSNLIQTDKISLEKLEQESYPFRRIKKFNDRYVINFFISRSIYVFDKAGNLIFEYLPDGSDINFTLPANFFLEGDFLHLLFSGENRVKVINITNSEEKFVELQFADGQDTCDKSASFFSFIPDRGEYLVATQKLNRDAGKQYYESARPIVSRFDRRGNFINGFGAFPKFYHKNHITGRSKYIASFSEGFVYVSFTHTNTVLKYDLEGGMEIIQGPKSNYMDYKLYAVDETRLTKREGASLQDNNNHTITRVIKSAGNEYYQAAVMRNNENRSSYEVNSSFIKFNPSNNKFSEVLLDDFYFLISVEKDKIEYYDAKTKSIIKAKLEF